MIKELPNGEGIIRKTLTLLDAESKDTSGTVRGTLPKTTFMYINQQVQAGQTVSYDLRLSVYDGIYDGPYKPYVDQTLSNRVKSAETLITQNAEEIALRATKTETLQMAQPNLTPYFSADPTDVYNSTNNPHGY